MQLKRDKGLCYTLEKKFSSSHRCSNRQYLVLHLDEEDLHQPSPEPPDIVATIDTCIDKEHHLSYNALKGSSSVGNMKFQGSIK